MNRTSKILLLLCVTMPILGFILVVTDRQFGIDGVSMVDLYKAKILHPRILIGMALLTSTQLLTVVWFFYLIIKRWVRRSRRQVHLSGGRPE